MSKIQIQVAYDGEALQTGSMNVRDLAPALLSIGNLCQEANRVLYGDNVRLTVNVQSGFQQGSFEVSMEVIQSLATQAKLFLLGENMTAAITLAGLVGLAQGGCISLIAFIKWLKGQKPAESITLENGNIKIIINSESLEVQPEIIQLYNDTNVRSALEGVIKPLEQPGINRFEVRRDKNIIESITREEVPYFLIPSIEEEITIDNERIAALEIVKLSFEEKYKWMFSDGNMTLNADIEDEGFLNKLNRREILFAKGDVLKVKLYTKSWRTEKGLRTEYKVLRVLEVIPSPRQISLFSPPGIEGE